MILQALVHLYDELAKQGKITPPGWGKAKVSHRLVLDEKGQLLGVVSAKKKVQQGKKEKEIPAEMDVPQPVNRSSGVKANFLCDTSSYFLGIDDKGKPERTQQCFEAAKALHHQILDNCPSMAAQAIVSFFDHWDASQARDNPIIKDQVDAILGASNFIFQVNGQEAIDDPAIRAAWQAYRTHREEAEGGDGEGICLVTGKEHQKISILHPKIKGVLGAQTSGANLVSFNADAFCSYGHDKEQGKNAPVSEEAAFAYGTALNYLLSDRDHTKIIGDTTVVYWSEHALSACQDCLMTFMGDNGMDENTLKTIVDHMKKGEPASVDQVEIDPDEPFYVLGLAPNAARLSVRFFLRNTFGAFVKNLSAHQDRMNLIHPAWEPDRIPLWRTLKATVNPNSKNAVSSPLLSGSLLRAVLNDSLYPEAVFQNIMRRIFSDRDKPAEAGKSAVYKISYVKAAFIKAYLLKNSNTYSSIKGEEKLEMAVNENCTQISYVLGRMFSVLEDIQQNANPGINSTIKDRYFNSACATPASVFPLLWKLSNAHLKKLSTPQAVYFQKKLGNLMEKITMPTTGMALPARLPLEEQGAFVLGYYQETQARFVKNK